VLDANFLLKIKYCFPFAYFLKNKDSNITSLNPHFSILPFYATLQIKIVEKWQISYLKLCINLNGKSFYVRKREKVNS